jgi:hypothetical protein
MLRLELAIPLGFLLALTVGILLLLAGLLAATLLLAGLLTRVLVLLARILILVAHSGSPLLNEARNNPGNRDWFRSRAGSAVIIARRRHVTAVTAEPGAQK